jgi:hypothetical protein
MVIDPYNRLEHHRPSNLTETEYISKLLDRLSNFAKRHNILIHLVAHPRKIQCKDGIFDVPNYYDINGSANFANKADYCLAIHRDKINVCTEIHVQKVKFKNLGCQGVAYLKYDIDTGNYYEENLGLPALDFSMPQQKKEQGKDEQLVQQMQTYLNRNVLDISVSYYTSMINKEGQQINLYSFLKNKNNDIDLDTMRQQPDFKEKKLSLPAVTVSGLFAGNHKTENLKAHSGLICIDIDKKDQRRDIEAIFDELKQLNNIAYLGRSCSGKGLFGIVPIKEPQKHLAHFLALEKDLTDKGIIIDKSGKDITRLRFYSYDPEAYYNIKAETYTSLYSPPVKEHRYNNLVITVDDDKKIADAIKDIQDNHINIAESYDEWRDLAIILNNEFGEEGRKLFHAVSSQSSKYNEGESNDFFDKIGSYGYQEKGMGSFYYMYDEAKKKYKFKQQ